MGTVSDSSGLGSERHWRRAVVMIAVVCLSAGLLSACQLGSVTLVAGGATHACALRSDGTVQCWGSNSFGELGNGTVVNQSSPVVVTGLIGAIQIGGGLNFSCAVLASGSVMCWGENSSGQLGDGTFTNRSTPVAVGGISTATQVSMGQGNHVCARLADNTARCWGSNTSGQMGDGTTTNRPNPVAVAGLTGIASLATGLGHSCALLNTGTESCWGSNTVGQLGDGTTTNRLSPVAVLGLSGIVQIATGAVHSCAVLTGALVTCWGGNAAGQLGDGSVNNRPTPPASISALSNVVQVAAGAAHTCAAKTDGTAWCWGANTSGEIGDGSTTTRFLPVKVTGLGSWEPVEVATMAVGADFSCAAMTTGNVKCWGANTSGDLGEGTDALRTTPVHVGTREAFTAGSISTRGALNCALKAGEVSCWGTNMTGDGTTTDRRTPVFVTNGVTQLASYGNGCAVISGGVIYCWGSNQYGMIGDGTTKDRPSPTGVHGLGGTATQAAVGGVNACALLSDTTVQCWGRGALYGGAGPGTPLPSTVAGLSGVAMISMGGSHSCVLMTNGTVQCWGTNSSGQLGDGTTVDRLTPVPVIGLTGVTKLSAGSTHTCALLSNGTAKCWGVGLGVGIGGADSSTPVSPTGLGTVTDISAGTLASCAVLTDQTVKCWGQNFYGSVGDGTTVNRTTPTAVLGLTGALEVSDSGAVSCARTAGNNIKCWGRSEFVGDDGIADRLTPVQVVLAV